MQRPTPKIIFAATAVAVLIMVILVTSVSSVSGSNSSTADSVSPVTVTSLPADAPLTDAAGPTLNSTGLDPVQPQAPQDPPAAGATPTLAPTLSPWGNNSQSNQPALTTRKTAVPETFMQPTQSMQQGSFSVPVISQTDPQTQPQLPGVAVVQPHFITPTPPPYFNNLPMFINTVANGQATNVAGVFVKNILAMPAVQQPANDSNWVSSDENDITLFQSAIEHGTIGLLAHNTRGGRVFDELKNGTTITLVFGDHSTKNFKVVGQQSYQALTPLDPTGDFIDLTNGARLTAGDVFSRVYAGTYPVVLQTCIEKNGDSEWGRLFILAEPA